MNLSKDLAELRACHSKISYINHVYHICDGVLNIEYFFRLNPNIQFVHKVCFHCPEISANSLTENQLDLLVFNLGMVELISYYKLACPLQVIIYPYKLSHFEEEFWKKLFFKGLGEFIFVNKIDVNDMDDITFTYCDRAMHTKPLQFESDPNKALIPVGGGKDSVVTLELSGGLDDLDRYILMVNPIKAALRCSLVSGIDESKYVIVKRSIDPLLLEMNQKGYLNGHVPFSATIAFISLIASSLIKAGYIVLSNETSANQCNITYLGMDINHQYSKSIEFESDFRRYVECFVCKDAFNYFSFLRSQNELEISALFAEMKDYHSNFLSCNKGGRADHWCGSCPKCLFVAVMISPFISREGVRRIFGKDLFNDLKLAELLNSLAGFGEYKPLECVGTFEEVQQALLLIKEKYNNSTAPLVHNFFKQHKDLNASTDGADEETQNRKNFLPPQFETLIL